MQRLNAAVWLLWSASLFFVVLKLVCQVIYLFIFNPQPLPSSQDEQLDGKLSPGHLWLLAVESCPERVGRPHHASLGNGPESFYLH